MNKTSNNLLLPLSLLAALLLATPAAGLQPRVAYAAAAPLKAEDEPGAPKDPSVKATAADRADATSEGIVERRELVRVGSDALLRANEVVPDMVVVLGNGTALGRIRGDYVVVGGDAELNGRVDGDFVVVMGNARLGPKAKVKGDAIVVFGNVDKSPGASIGGEHFEMASGVIFPKLTPIWDWCKSGLLLGRPLPPGVGWAWWVVGFCFFIYLIIALILPQPVEKCVQVLDVKALPAFFMGLLGLLLVHVLLLILSISVVGLLIVPFLWIAMMAAILLGKTAVFQFLGLQLLRRGNPEANPRSLLAFVAGSALVCLLYMVPFLGFVAWGVWLVLGFGASLMAAYASLKKNGKPAGTSGSPQSPLGPIVVPAATLVPGAVPVQDPTMPPLVQTPLAAGVTAPPPLGAEAVALPRAGFWIRCAATFLDFVLFFWLIPATGGTTFLVAWLAYHVGMWVWRGTTIGGIVCGLKVVRLDGRPVDFSVALVRALSSIFSAISLCIGFFWAGWSADCQSWHDKIAGTVIVKVPKGVSLI